MGCGRGGKHRQKKLTIKYCEGRGRESPEKQTTGLVKREKESKKLRQAQGWE